MSVLEICLWIAKGLLGVATALTMARMAKGPSLMDRLMALDYLSLIVIGFILLEGREQGSRVLVAPAVALALVSFIATIAFARLLEGHGKEEKGG